MTYYEVVKKITDTYRKYCSTVDYVMEFEIDLDRTNIYPAAYVVPTDVNFNGSTQGLGFDIYVVDRKDESDIDKREENTPGNRQDNLVDIIADVLVIHGRAIGELDRGTETTFALDASRPLTLVTSAGKNDLYGYSTSIVVTVPNSDVDDGIC